MITIKKQRRAITLVEVAFSMGIILIGMAGFVVMLPVAGRQANEAISLNSATALATSGIAQFEARHYLQSGRWVLKPDFSIAADSSLNPPRPMVTEGVTTFLNSLQHPNFAITSSAVCIDPLMVAYRPGYYSVAAGGPYSAYSGLGTNGHRRLRFPYYKANYNPYVNPSEPVTAGNQWPLMARMTRATINRGTSIGGQFISEGEAQLLSETGDELNIKEPDDQSLNAALIGNNVTGTGVGFGQAQTEGTYSWIATVNDLPGTDYASVSIAVIDRRDRSFFTYPNDGSVADSPESNATDERLAYVTFAGGFKGGAGGTVQVQMSAFVDPAVRPGQWVMLSRSTPLGQVHRWYRITGVIGEPERLIVSDPFTGDDRDVWQLRMMLDGPDWSFGFVTPGPADGVIADNTMMTFVRNVVSVTERTIKRP